MPGLEQPILDDWVKARMVGDATLNAIINGRAFQGLAPPDAGYPLVVFQLQVPGDVMGLGTARIFSNLQYLMKVLIEGPDWSPNQRAAVARMDALFHGVINQTITGGSVLSVMRTEPYSLIEPYEGKQVRHLGGLYTFQVQAS